MQTEASLGFWGPLSLRKVVWSGRLLPDKVPGDWMFRLGWVSNLAFDLGGKE